MYSHFGPFWLLRRIGLGDLAEVFVAVRTKDTDTNQLAAPLHASEGSSVLAVKRIWREMANYDEIHQLLTREGELAAQLTHPNVVKVYDVGGVDNRPYIAMEYIPGADLAHLRDRCGTTGLAPGPAVRLILDICAALAYVHDARGHDGRPLHVVHGDVTPANILVSTLGVAKLIDFSVAVSAISDAQDRTVRGTYGYMSPEQARGESLDRRTDVFALGVVLWELLSGKRLFRRRANYLTLAAVVEDPVPALANQELTIGAEVVEIDRILRKALAKRRQDRYGEVAELAADLRPVAEQCGWDLRPWYLQTTVRSLLSESSQRARPRHPATASD